MLVARSLAVLEHMPEVRIALSTKYFRPFETFGTILTLGH